MPPFLASFLGAIRTHWQATVALEEVLSVDRVYTGNPPPAAGLPFATLEIQEQSWDQPTTQATYLMEMTFLWTVHIDDLSEGLIVIELIEDAFDPFPSVLGTTILRGDRVEHSQSQLEDRWLVSTQQRCLFQTSSD
ncbi:Hypothetical protein PBC10988_27610 [Planctomycetales bacterium 10988]|nr:Hypothetical protein PBC10988_27610 [Planctomycetales bacterium 10988]